MTPPLQKKLPSKSPALLGLNCLEKYRAKQCPLPGMFMFVQ